MGNRIARPVRPQVPAPPLNPVVRPSSVVQYATNASSSRSPSWARRERLNRLWTRVNEAKNETAHDKLIRAGFVVQSQSGVFQLLPLGLRLQDKITRLVDYHMRGLGASRVQLSALTHESLWLQSGRLNKIGSELFRLQDRKGAPYLLSPTHEEAITTLVADYVKSHDQLPLRLYQITQKYRDELRPRQGLLRSRDFLMKDLYTFDYGVESALKTYDEVRVAYARIFLDDLKLPMLIAEASSGDMGGNLSHEYHLPMSMGEDQVVSCSHCDYVANEEVAEARAAKIPMREGTFHVWRGISSDRTTIVNVWYGKSSPTRDETIVDAPQDAINTYAVKKVFPELDSGVTSPHSVWSGSRSENAKPNFNVVNLFDTTIPEEARPRILASQDVLPQNVERSPSSLSNGSGETKDTSDPNPPTNYLRIQPGDTCPRCNHDSLELTKAMELGHTFHLGTRYSEPLKALVHRPKETSESAADAAGEGDVSADNTGGPRRKKTAMQMGCHGIGISRIMGALAAHVSVRGGGLRWPRAVAPYEVVLVAQDDGVVPDEGAVLGALYDQAVARGVDAVLDDQPGGQRKQRYGAYELVGIPVYVVVGKGWAGAPQPTVHLRCDRLAFSELVPAGELWERVEELLDRC